LFRKCHPKSGTSQPQRSSFILFCRPKKKTKQGGLIFAFKSVLLVLLGALGRKRVLGGLLLVLVGGRRRRRRYRRRQQRLVMSISTPIYNECLTNAEQHDGDLGDGEEAPDGRLFHEIRWDPTRQIRSKRKQKDSLNHHSFLLVESKEGGEHTKRMDGGTWNHIRWICHWHWPRQMVQTFVSANFVTSEPFGGGSVESLWPHSRQKKSSEQHPSSNKTKSLNDSIFL